MSSIKTVAVAGATGNLGPSVVDQLVKAGFSVTALTRQSSTSTPPSGIKAIPVDYDSVASLTTALKGQDAVVSTLSHMTNAIPLIDAAIAAGVTRVLPSEFGCDTSNPNARKLPIFGGKVKTSDYLAEKAKEGKISYTLVETGPFLDWGLDKSFVANLKGTTDVFDGGDRLASMTTLADIGRAVAEVLKHPAETANRSVKTQSAALTQNQILAIANNVTGRKYETRPVNTEESESQAYEALQKGDMSKMVNFLFSAVWREGYGGKFDEAKLDNKLLGIEELTDKQVEELIAKYA